MRPCSATSHRNVPPSIPAHSLSECPKTCDTMRTSGEYELCTQTTVDSFTVIHRDPVRRDVIGMGVRVIGNEDHVRPLRFNDFGDRVRPAFTAVEDVVADDAHVASANLPLLTSLSDARPSKPSTSALNHLSTGGFRGMG